MDFFIDNILYIAVLFTIVGFIFFFLKQKNMGLKFDIKGVNSDKTNQIEIRLRAYERLTLLLDRIRPLGMINRLELTNCDIKTLKVLLVKNIVAEYEYNISQQIYTSDELWTMINVIKNKIIKSIYTVSDGLNQTDNSDTFVKAFMNQDYEINVLIKKVQKNLKKEVRELSKLH